MRCWKWRWWRDNYANDRKIREPIVNMEYEIKSNLVANLVREFEETVPPDYARDLWDVINVAGPKFTNILETVQCIEGLGLLMMVIDGRRDVSKWDEQIMSEMQMVAEITSEEFATFFEEKTQEEKLAMYKNYKQKTNVRCETTDRNVDPDI